MQEIYGQDGKYLTLENETPLGKGGRGKQILALISKRLKDSPVKEGDGFLPALGAEGCRHREQQSDDKKGEQLNDLCH